MSRNLATVYLDECEFAGLDPKKVGAVARRLASAVKDAQDLGLFIFGGAGSGTLRWAGDGTDRLSLGALVVAELGFGFDGGDGATHNDEAGLLRGEDG